MSFWTENTVDDLRRLWPTAKSTREIGRELHCSNGAVASKARQIDLPFRPVTRPMPHKSKFDDGSLQAKVRDLTADGLTLMQIAGRVGVCSATVCKVRKILGIKTGRRPVRHKQCRYLDPAPMRHPEPPPPPPSPPRCHICLWQDGKGRDAVRCAMPRADGAPYCVRHADIAFPGFVQGGRA